jgi:raffinose/stachyose/melibiose transport system permease protein
MKTPTAFLVWFLAPAFVMYTVFVALPGAQALWYSLYRWDGFTAAKWVGLEHYRELFSERGLFLAALSHNLFLAATAGTVTLTLALVFAAMLHRGIRGAGLFRVAFFFPNTLAAVAVALLWILLYSTTELGAFNAALGGLQSAATRAGFDTSGWPVPFAFLDSKTLIASIAPMLVWANTGFFMVLFLAAMQGIPETYYEAAKLDGAGPARQFFHITLPMLRDVLVVAAVFQLITLLKFFDAVWVMENEMPGNDTHVLATLMYQRVFSEYRIGSGAAIAALLFLLVFAGSALTFRLSRKEAIEH